MEFIGLKSSIPGIISGSSFADERGMLQFVNDARLDDIKRFYILSNANKNIIRAWQAHKIERKCFFALEGTFVIGLVRIDNFENPSPELKADRFILKADAPQLLVIPAGYANGLRALTDQNKLLVFSTLSLEESKEDSYRFPSHLWMDWRSDEFDA